MKTNREMIPAIPPVDYKGSVGKWIVELINRGLIPESKADCYYDYKIPADDWWEILEKLES